MTEKDNTCLIFGHDYEPIFFLTGRDIYKCSRCGHEIDMTEDEDCET